MKMLSVPLNLSFLLLLLLLLLLCSSAVAPVYADIYDFSTELDPGFPRIIRVQAMFAPQDAPTKWPPGNGESYVSMDLSFASRDLTSNIGRVQALIVADPTLAGLGYHDKVSDQTSYCCTKELFEQQIPGCVTPGELIVNGNFMRWSTTMFSAKTEDTLTTRMDVSITAQHVLLLATCPTSIDDTASMPIVAASGRTVWMNPFGYLPGFLYGFLPFYAIMLALYFVFTLLFSVLYLRHRSAGNVIALQRFIWFVLCLCVVEMVLQLADYGSLNTQGTRHTGLVVSAIITSSIRETVSRCLVVAVSLGYGVVEQSLGRKKAQLFFLGILYFACNTALELVIRYGQTNVVAQQWRLVLAIPVALMNAVFYWWTFIALFHIVSRLRDNRQELKLIMYRRFTSLLVLSLIAAVVFSLFQIYFITTNMIYDYWELVWLVEGGGFVQILYAVVLFGIAILWRPSKDSRSYGYAQISSAVSMYDDDEEDFQEIELGQRDSVGGGGGGGGAGGGGADGIGAGDGGNDRFRGRGFSGVADDAEIFHIQDDDDLDDDEF